MSAALLTPLMITLPIGMAALMVALGGRLPRRVLDVLATATAATVAALAVVLLVATATAPGRVIAWAGGWTPRQGMSIGIALVSDPISAGLAIIAAVLATAALVYSWRYFDAVDVYFHALMLVFLAAMCGFVLTGDLFDMFVWFELMSAVAYALTGYKIEEAQSVQGALNFGVTNSIGAFCTLIGITLLYDRTGALNFAALGANLAGQRPDALVVASFVLLVTGFLTKAAVVPFHFWTADAEAVAPIPVCALFSGIMVELGIYAVARTYWTVYSGTLPPSAIRGPLLAFGVLSAVVGGVMCLAQRHIKRLLAFSTVSHIGLFLVGVALLSPAGLAGTAVYILGQAGVEAALFLLVGVILLRLGAVSERDLHGRGGGMPITATLTIIGGVALAGLPPFATGLGKAITEDAGVTEGFGWLVAVFVGASALTAAAVLRMAARVFFGLGSPAAKDPTSRGADEDEGEEVEEVPTGGVPRTMLIPPAVLLATALGLGLLPGLGGAIGQIASDFFDRAAYASQVLGLPTPEPRTAAVHVSGFTAASVGYGLLSTGLAVLIAALTILRSRLPRWTLAVARAALPLLRGLRALHSGHVGDYAMWLVVGVVALGGAVSLILG
ncbi:MAG: NADH-quinone oxidoreductase subunit D [Pseudonocardiales bacterium]|nr:MAG: NADH-quinone oxidoreductase subunit D [Pseudonocardiales bacterium]